MTPLRYVGNFRPQNLGSPLDQILDPHLTSIRTGKTGKHEKMGRHFPVGKSQGILNRLEKSGKTTQNTGKLREFQKKIICYFSIIFK